MLNLFKNAIGIKATATASCSKVCTTMPSECSMFQFRWYYLKCSDGSKKFLECCP